MQHQQDHWFVYGAYTRGVYLRMRDALHQFATFPEIEALMDEAARLARKAGYADANAYLVLGGAKRISQNLAGGGTGDDDSYLSNVRLSSQSLSGIARTMKTAYEVRTGLQGVEDAYEEGRQRRLDER